MILPLALSLLLSTPTTEALRAYPVNLIGCYDADTCTFDVRLGMDVTLQRQVFRLCDINAPEIRPLATREAAKKSRDTLVAWIRAASVVEVRVPQEKGRDEKGKYGRWLAYIYADGVNLNAKLVERGLATEYPEKCQ